ncbi:unnamed protein product [Rhizoctonia solani]|uniref:RING-type domain-containing protein n=1 Tax=Rhizoctonia solani TaxID=456999 RepID=A0A8H2XTP8_9AGAM|nr:unnamed protein product [Rhizoctonia solani]
MANNHEDPPWLRPAPILVVSRDTDEMNNPKISISSVPAAIPKPNALSRSLPATARSPGTAPQAALLPSPNIPAPGLPSPRVAEEAEYVGWRPQQITAQQVTQSPPLSPLDLAMYPGARAPPRADPMEARKAVAGLKPLRILSTRRPGGPASAGPSRRPSVEVMGSNYNSFSGLVGFFSAAKRASVATVSGPPSASSRASTQSISVAHTPIPVSPLPPPRTPPLVPKPSLAPELLEQMEPELRAHLEALATQATAGSGPPSSSRPVSALHRPKIIPTNLVEDEEIVLEIRDLNTGEVIKIRDLDAVPLNGGANRESQFTSQRSPSISDFMVVRDLDTQPRTPPPIQPQQRNRMPKPRPLTPQSSSPIESHSPTLLTVSDPYQPRLRSPVTPLTEAVYVNRSLELSLSSLEDALSVARKFHHSRTPSSASASASTSTTRRDELPQIHTIQTPKTARSTRSLTSSMFSSRMIGTPLTTPPESPPHLPQTSKEVLLPCMVCSRPMQNMTSTRCGHVFCRGCVEGRSRCPVCRVSVEDSDLRAIYLYV